MKYALMNEYTDSGANQAQVIEMNQYNGMTTGSITAPAWDGSKGGLVVWFDKATTTINGTLTSSGKGFGGGTYSNYGSGGGDLTATAFRAEGTVADNSVRQKTSNGNGGGGGANFGDWGAGGGGGGNGAAGGNARNNDIEGGDGGTSVGNAGLTAFNFGGGGGGGREKTNGGDSGTSSDGAPGGGGFFIFASDIVVTGTIVTGGSTAGNATGDSNGAGGGGAGGSVLLKCQTATLGTVKITAPAGSGGHEGGTVGANGANGAVGRIHIDYSGSYTGTTNPTIDVTNDLTIIDPIGGGFLLNFF